MTYLPRHVAIIPDGNRRWAKEHGLASWEGHAKGAKRFVDITNSIFEWNIPFFTFWAASEDNLRKRKKAEVSFLVKLLRAQLRKGLKPFDRRDIKLRVLGRGADILDDGKLGAEIKRFEELSPKNALCNLTIAFGYDGVTELLQAVNRLNEYNLPPYEREELESHLWSKDLPPVDLVIRTGELDTGWAHNSSGFMMLHTANSELYFPKMCWPDFSAKQLEIALEGYSKRRRLLGA